MKNNRTEGCIEVAKCFGRRFSHGVIRIAKRLLIVSSADVIGGLIEGDELGLSRPW